MEKHTWTIGESVVVKPGVSDPDVGGDIGGWQGRIVEIFADEEIVLIRWDSLTLESMSRTIIAKFEEEGLDWSEMNLGFDDVLPATTRDTEEEVTRVRKQIESQTGWLHLGGEQGKRVQAIVNQARDNDDDDEDDDDEDDDDEDDDDEDDYSDFAVMQTWHEHLTKQLVFPFTAIVTEEQRGPIREGAEVTVLGIDGDVDDLYGTLVDVRAERKSGTLPLCDLKATKADAATQQLVDDYSMWFANR